jgi:hypothetical protein
VALPLVIGMAAFLVLPSFDSPRGGGVQRREKQETQH